MQFCYEQVGKNDQKARVSERVEELVGTHKSRAIQHEPYAHADVSARAQSPIWIWKDKQCPKQQEAEGKCMQQRPSAVPPVVCGYCSKVH